jgi:hypothetical protein
MFFGTAGVPTHPRSISPGEPGDLTLLSAPTNEVLSELDSDMVAATVVAGEVVFERG